ncbi:hypothetical protein, partial [Prevotella sp. kh1p2]|uniref:hypothetical protein n=1 Tax=Prevotella sp. kh1p2 TaxID=1761883 RepID=UPI001C4331A7
VFKNKQQISRKLAAVVPPLRKGRLGGDDILSSIANVCHMVIPSSASPFQGEDTSLSLRKPLLCYSYKQASL